MATYALKILISNVYILFVTLCFVLRIQSTFLNIEELQKSKYGVEISALPVLLNNQDKDGSIMRITSKHGQQYQCVLPIVHFETKESSTINVTTEEINKLLQPLNNTCLFQLNGWWSYRVCIGRSIFQYHDEGHQVKDNISLGNFSGNTDWSNVTIKEETKGDNRYHSQFYNNGTVCDLTAEPRKTEIRFFCGSQTTDLISRIDESSTCNYIINIHTHKLCNHSLFRPPAKAKKHSITCSPALKEDQYKKYTDAQNRKSEKTIEDDQPVSNSDEKDEHNNNGRMPDIADALAKMYHKENIKETEHGRELKTKEEKTMNMMKGIIAKSMKQIEKLKRGDNPQDDNEEEAHSEEVSDNDDSDDDGDDDDGDDDDVDDEGDDIYEETRNKILKAKRNGMKMTIDDAEAYDEQVGEDIDDDIGWDVDNTDDDNTDIEGSSSLFEKINSFSNSKKDKKGDQSDYYQELIEHLKLQFRYFKKQLDSITNDLKKRIKISESSVNPDVRALIDTTKKSVKNLENKQRVAEDAMKRLADLYDAVMEDSDYKKAREELASIRATLVGLIDKVNSKSEPLEPNNDDNHDDNIDESGERKRQSYKPSEEMFEPDKKTQGFDMEKPNLDKVVSKLKKIMTRENDDGDTDGDDRINVRVTKIKKKSEDLYDDKDFEKSFIEDNDENQLDEISESEEMREATKKLERMVRKQFQDAGVHHEGKIKVKIVTSQESLQRIADGKETFQIFTSQVKFRDLLSNLLGGTRQLAEEKRRQEAMEDNYNLVWKQDGFTSAPVSEKQSSLEHEDSDESR